MMETSTFYLKFKFKAPRPELESFDLKKNPFRKWIPSVSLKKRIAYIRPIYDRMPLPTRTDYTVLVWLCLIYCAPIVPGLIVES
jgi:hypothetical protein